jgi:hypothetical protein
MRGVLGIGQGIAAVLLAAALAGCSSVGNMLGSSSTSSQEAGPAAESSPGAAPPKDSLTTTLLGKPAGAGAPADNIVQQEDLTCPDVTVRSGAGTLLLGSKGPISEVGAMDLRYQGSLVKFARECKAAGNVMTMKIGIEGRIIVGPAGGPGQVEVPLRMAIVQEGPTPKIVLSKLVRIPVTIGSDSTVEFTHIDSDVAFPMPQPITALDAYVVYVGFDPTALAGRHPAPRRKR